MTGYINKEKAAHEVRRLGAINSGFFANLIEKLDCNDFWKDAKTNPPGKSGQYIVSVYNKTEDKWFSFGSFYQMSQSEWTADDNLDYEVFFWANYPEPKTKNNMEEQ